MKKSSILPLFGKVDLVRVFGAGGAGWWWLVGVSGAGFYDVAFICTA